MLQRRREKLAAYSSPSKSPPARGAEDKAALPGSPREAAAERLQRVLQGVGRDASGGPGADSWDEEGWDGWSWEGEGGGEWEGGRAWEGWGGGGEWDGAGTGGASAAASAPARNGTGKAGKGKAGKGKACKGKGKGKGKGKSKGQAKGKDAGASVTAGGNSKGSVGGKGKGKGKGPVPLVGKGKGRGSGKGGGGRSVLTKEWKLDAVPLDCIENGSLWAASEGHRDEVHAQYVQGMQAELLQVFTPKSKSKSPGAAASPKLGPRTPRKETVELIDSKRAYLASIILAPFRRNFENVRRALLDGTKDLLSLSQLDPLMQVAPTECDLETVRKFKGEGPFGECTAYYLSIKDIPDVRARLSTLHLRLTLQTKSDEVRRKLGAIRDCCKQLKSSTKTACVLEVLLGMGNTLNAKKADGFRLSSLLTLVDTVSPNEKEVTLLHFFARTLQEKHAELEHFYEEVPLLGIAAPLDFAQLREEFTRMREVSCCPGCLRCSLTLGTMS